MAVTLTVGPYSFKPKGPSHGLNRTSVLCEAAVNSCSQGKET